MIKGLANPKLFIVSAFFSGLAQFTRQDGVLLILVLVMVIFVSQYPIKIKVKYLAISLVFHFSILFPLLISNLQSFGALFPSGPSKTAFLTDYQDIYAYSKTFSLDNYLAWGFSNIVTSKIKAATTNFQSLYELLGPFIILFTFLGVWDWFSTKNNHKQWKTVFPPLLYLEILFVFYTMIATFPGKDGFMRSEMAVTPFLLVIAVDFIDRRISSRRIVTLSILVIGLLFFYQGLSLTASTIDENIRINKRMTALKEVIAGDAHNRSEDEIIIMTRSPWETYHSTRYKAIQIPNEELDIIYQVTQKYRANYLVLPAPRTALKPVYKQETVDNRFQFVADVPDCDLKIFYIVTLLDKPD